MILVIIGVVCVIIILMVVLLWPKKNKVGEPPDVVLPPDEEIPDIVDEEIPDVVLPPDEEIPDVVLPPDEEIPDVVLPPDEENPDIVDPTWSPGTLTVINPTQPQVLLNVYPSLLRSFTDLFNARRRQSQRPVILSMGDSILSGQGGRWAGNGDVDRTDALGPDWDNQPGQLYPDSDCARSKSAPIKIGRIESVNFACSGARILSFVNDNGQFKPGIDFVNDPRRGKGQCTMLKEFGKTNNIKMIALLTGGNDFNFVDLITECASRFVTFRKACSTHSDFAAFILSEPNIQSVKLKLKVAIDNIYEAMKSNLYKDEDWTLMILNYPQLFPVSDDLRFLQSRITRVASGCPFYDKDIDGAVKKAVPLINKLLIETAKSMNKTNMKFVETQNLTEGHQLCEKGTTKINNRNIGNWRNIPESADKSEWINEIRLGPLISDRAEADVNDSMHPNYFGQLAQRNCIRQAWNNGNPLSGVCTNELGVNERGEPNVKFVASRMQ